ncbi:MAG: hypothetical protein KGR26_00615 [Cyanobacteria bacterium REEB65]|nr:hypothetical protein [Cyanobacteria bacterium REEB65]
MRPLARILPSLGLMAMAGCLRHLPSVETVRLAPGPSASPEISASEPVPSASPASSASPLFTEDQEASSSKIPISAGPQSDLFYYDPVLVDLFAIPGAGHDIENPSFFDGDRRIVFDQDGEIYAWDRYLDTREALQAVNQIPDVSDPGWDASASVMVFHNPSSAYLFARFDEAGLVARLASASEPTRASEPPASASSSTGASAVATASPRPSAAPPPQPSAPPAVPSPPLPAAAFSNVWLQGVVVGLAKIAAVGSRHGGIADANIDNNDIEVAFITGDGGLYLYWLSTGSLEQVTIANSVGDGHVEEMALSPAGDLVVFRSGDHLYLYRLLAETIDPLPYANLAYNAIRAHTPLWITNREFYYRLDLPGGRMLFARYNWLTETVRAAFFFNAVLGVGFQAISSP